MNHIYFKRDRDKPISFLNRQILINQISRNAVKINIVHLRQNPDYFIPQLTIWLRHPVYFTEIFWSVVRWQHRVRNMIFQDFRILIIKQNILSCSLLKVLKWRQTWCSFDKSDDWVLFKMKVLKYALFIYLQFGSLN